MKKPKIIFLGPLPPPVMGPSLATEIILNSKLNDHFQIIHCDTSDHRELTTLGRIDLMNFFLAFRHYLKLIKLIIRHWPKMVYIPVSQTTMGYFRDAGFILIAKSFRRKVVCHLRGGNFKNWLDASSPLTRWLVIHIHRKIDAQIVLGENLRALFTGIIPPDHIYVIPNGGNYTFPVRESSDGVVRLLFLSNLLPEKGILDSIKAMTILSSLRIQTPYRLDVYGSWQDMETKNSALQLIPTQSSITFFHRAPSREDKMKSLANADILLFPSYYPPEGHPWVIVEAMAAGLPIISTEQGAITESVMDEVNGFIVEKKNPEAIADKLKKLIENSTLRQKMGRESRRLYEEKYTEEKMVTNLANCFNGILSVYDVKRWYSELSNNWWMNYSSGNKYFDRRFKNVHLLLDNQKQYCKILDIGCGTGEITASVGERFSADTIGIDISDKMVEYCKTKYKDKINKFAEGNILDLKYLNCQFDLILALSVIEWIDDYEKAIEEVTRVLKPGGQWIVSIPNWRSPFRKLEYLRSLFLKKSYLNYQRNRVTINNFQKTAEKYGLILNKSKYHVLPIFDIQISGKIGAWLNMMCMMSFNKIGNENEATNPKA